MIVKNRVKKHSEFQKIISEGEVKKTYFFVFYSLNNELGYSRFGISVPKKIGDAVVRNKVKRQIRACIAQLSNYEKPIDTIIIVRKNYDTSNFAQIMSELKVSIQ